MGTHKSCRSPVVRHFFGGVLSKKDRKQLFFRFSLELQKHARKFKRTRESSGNAYLSARTPIAFPFSQTSTRVSCEQLDYNLLVSLQIY